jgi:hypothetical protein
MIALSPILVKAIDFLFQERKERKEASKKNTTPVPKVKTGLSTRNSVSTETISTKEAALSQQVSEAAWKNSEAKVKHLMSLLEIQTRNYYLAKEQYSKWGSALVPPIIVNNLSEAENEVAETTRNLESELSEIFGKPVVINEA